MNEDAALAVVRVGNGRGFVVQGEVDRLVITAAHCLPSFPPCASFSYLKERTYPKLLGRLRGRKQVWAECLFVDPIGDIAVLGPPDSQELNAEYEAYWRFVETAEPLTVSDLPKSCSASLLSLDGRWFNCAVKHIGGPLWLFQAAQGIVGGMSGSPIIDDKGAAIGVLACSGSTAGNAATEGGPNPRLATNLPGWCLRQIRLADGP